MLRPEHEHTDADPVCLYLTMECVELADIWVRWCRRPSADADAVGEAVPPTRTPVNILHPCLVSEGTSSPAAFKSLHITNL